MGLNRPKEDSILRFGLKVSSLGPPVVTLFNLHFFQMAEF